MPSPAPARPRAATVPGRPMMVDYVAVSTRGGGSDPTTPPTTPPPGGGSAYSTIQAESYSQQGGLGRRDDRRLRRRAEPHAGRQRRLGALPDVDFGSSAARQFIGRVASGAAGGVSGLVEVRLDSRSNRTDRELRDRQHRRLAKLAQCARQHQRGDRRPQRLPDLHQRPAGRLRQRQLVHLQPLTRVH